MPYSQTILNGAPYFKSVRAVFGNTLPAWRAAKRRLRLQRLRRAGEPVIRRVLHFYSRFSPPPPRGGGAQAVYVGRRRFLFLTTNLGGGGPPAGAGGKM